MNNTRGSVSSVFSSSSQKQVVAPTYSMEAVIAPLQEQANAFAYLPQAVLADSAKRRNLLGDAQRIHDALTRLQQSVTQLDVDSDLGLTAGIRHRISMDYDAALEQADTLVNYLRQPAIGTGPNTVSVDRIARTSNSILSSVTSAMFAYDQTVVVRLEAAGNQMVAGVKAVGEAYRETPIAPARLQDRLKTLHDCVMRFATLARARLADLKDECQRTEINCCLTTLEHCYKCFISSVKVLLLHPDIPLGKVTCGALTDNFLENVTVIVRSAAVPYEKAMWKRLTPLSQDFEALEGVLSQAVESLSIDSQKEQCASELCRQLDAIILHAKQIAESPRTGDRAGDRLLSCCDDAVNKLATVLQVAAEDEESFLDGSTVSGGAANASFAGSTVSMTRGEARRSSVRNDSRLSRNSSMSGVFKPSNIVEAMEVITDAVANLRKYTHVALSQHIAAALAQMNRGRLLVTYLQENAMVRNFAKKSEYSSQLLSDVEQFEEVVSSVCSISTDLRNVLQAKRALSELRVLCPQVVSAGQALYQQPSSKATRANMAAFEHAWQVEMDKLMAAVRELEPAENVIREVSALDRNKSASFHTLSGPRLTSASVHRTSSINSFQSFRTKIQQKRASASRSSSADDEAAFAERLATLHNL